MRPLGDSPTFLGLAITGSEPSSWLRAFRSLGSPAPPPTKPQPQGPSPSSLRLGWNSRLAKAGLILLVAAALLLVRYRLIWVVGSSMRPTYRTGDLLVVDKFAYRKAKPARGDIVVARHQNDWIVKRVMGLPGERIEVRRGHVEINGQRLAADFAVEPGWLDIAPGTLLEDRYAILGDNRSVDSFSFIHAVVPSSHISGKVVWSFRR